MGTYELGLGVASAVIAITSLALQIFIEIPQRLVRRCPFLAKGFGFEPEVTRFQMIHLRILLAAIMLVSATGSFLMFSQL